jgi:hypothetical protein
MQEATRRYLPSAIRLNAPETRSERALDVNHVANAVSATFLQSLHRGEMTPEAGINGGLLARPRIGGRGIAGIRADILSGALTIREVAMMPVPVMKRRYRVSGAHARKLRLHIAKYGVDGKTRLLNGMPRDGWHK